MKTRSHIRSAFFAFALLIGLFLACFLWMQYEASQHILDRNLISAILRNDNKKVIQLLEAGANPNIRWIDVSSPSLRDILAQPALLLPKNRRLLDTPALTMACRFHHSPDLSHIEALLRHGAKVNAREYTGCTALINVVGISRSNEGKDQNDIALIKLLLSYGADPTIIVGNINGSSGDNALNMAVPYPKLLAILQHPIKHH